MQCARGGVGDEQGAGDAGGQDVSDAVFVLSSRGGAGGEQLQDVWDLSAQGRAASDRAESRRTAGQAILFDPARGAGLQCAEGGGMKLGEIIMEHTMHCERCGITVFFEGTLLEAHERAKLHECPDEGGE
jgi:hypothetical protein